MKAIVCLGCMDIRALDPSPNVPVECRCGNVIGRWVDPQKGTMIVAAEIGTQARVLGMHNGMFTMSNLYGYNNEHNHNWYGDLNREITEGADGYVFKQWGSWAALIVPGSTNDTRFTGREEVLGG